MTHHDEGNYARKKSTVSDPAPELMDAVKAASKNGEISCVAAHRAASSLGEAPESAGRAADLLELKISKCQLGLFGYGKGVKLVTPAESVPEDLEREIRSSLTEGRITCRDLWAIADKRKMPRLEASRACEKLGVKITRCQLGAF